MSEAIANLNLDEKTTEILSDNGITDVSQLRAEGFELTSLEGIGKGRAKQIKAALETHDASADTPADGDQDPDGNSQSGNPPGGVNPPEDGSSDDGSSDGETPTDPEAAAEPLAEPVNVQQSRIDLPILTSDVDPGHVSIKQLKLDRDDKATLARVLAGFRNTPEITLPNGKPIESLDAFLSYVLKTIAHQIN